MNRRRDTHRQLRDAEAIGYWLLKLVPHIKRDRRNLLTNFLGEVGGLLTREVDLRDGRAKRLYVGWGEIDGCRRVRASLHGADRPMEVENVRSCGGRLLTLEPANKEFHACSQQTVLARVVTAG